MGIMSPRHFEKEYEKTIRRESRLFDMVMGIIFSTAPVYI